MTPPDPAAAPPAPLAVVEDLTVEAGGRRLVDRVSFTVRAGRILAVVGPSGSGKTTTGLALLGAPPPGATVTGTVRRAGDAVVGHVPQHPGAVLNPARRISALLEDLARPQVAALPRARRRTERRRRVLDALAAAGLDGPERLLDRYPHQLSGGQQQRVVIAQALLFGARILVADEPTTGQDALTKSRVAGRLADLARSGVAVVLLSHDLDVVRELADEVLVMREGRIVAAGPAAQVLTHPDPPASHRPRGRPSAATTTGSAPDALRIRHLVARHRSSTLLRVDDLALRPGELLALVGRSGSGKTTLGRCAAGLHRDHTGTILVDGVPLPRGVRGRNRSQLASVQYVFQDARASFGDGATVLGQVSRTAVRLRGLDRGPAGAEALKVLRSLGLLPGTAERRPAELSGGELQRAALARALLARPRVLVCDEITSGLDAASRSAVMDLLTGLRGQEDGPAVLLITHDLDSAALADRIVVLEAGEPVESGPARQVLEHPRHAFTVALTGALADVRSRQDAAERAPAPS